MAQLISWESGGGKRDVREEQSVFYVFGHHGLVIRKRLRIYHFKCAFQVGKIILSDFHKNAEL